MRYLSNLVTLQFKTSFSQVRKEKRADYLMQRPPDNLTRLFQTQNEFSRVAVRPRYCQAANTDVVMVEQLSPVTAHLKRRIEDASS